MAENFTIHLRFTQRSHDAEVATVMVFRFQDLIVRERKSDYFPGFEATKRRLSKKHARQKEEESDRWHLKLRRKRHCVRDEVPSALDRFFPNTVSQDKKHPLIVFVAFVPLCNRTTSSQNEAALSRYMA